MSMSSDKQIQGQKRKEADLLDICWTDGDSINPIVIIIMEVPYILLIIAQLIHKIMKNLDITIFMEAVSLEIQILG